MKSSLARRDSISLFQINDDVIAIVSGTKPRHCEGPRLVRQGGGKFSLECNCQKACIQRSDPSDRFFLVQPIAPKTKTGEIEVVHRDGRERLKICPLAPTKSDIRPAAAGAFGVSQDFSLEAAFKDALSKLNPKSLHAPSLVEVVSMGALYGGFSGFSRLFVRVEATPYDLRNGGDKI
jgi:hypothetical protein